MYNIYFDNFIVSATYFKGILVKHTKCIVYFTASTIYQSFVHVLTMYFASFFKIRIQIIIIFYVQCYFNIVE